MKEHIRKRVESYSTDQIDEQHTFVDVIVDYLNNECDADVDAIGVLDALATYGLRIMLMDKANIASVAYMERVTGDMWPRNNIEAGGQ